MKSIIYIDEEVFNQNEYGEATITKRSKFFTQQTDNKQPSWLDGTLVSNLLNDEIDYL